MFDDYDYSTPDDWSASNLDDIGIDSYAPDTYEFDVDSFVYDVNEGLGYTGASESVTSIYALNYEPPGGTQIRADGGTGVGDGLTTSATQSGSSSGSSSSSSGGSWISTLANFATKNSSDLLKLGMGAISGAASASASKEAAALKVQSDKELLAQADALKQDAQKRYSDSISGMSPIAKKTYGPLKRLDGSNVFSNNRMNVGLINGGTNGAQ